MNETLQELLDADSIFLSGVDVDAVVARLASHPHEAAIKMEFGTTPLHMALRVGTDENPITVNVLNAFLGAHKDAVFEIDDNGETPLHNACGCGVEIVQALLQANHKAASVRDKHGNIPLHDAHNSEVVKVLLETYPEGVGVADNDGWLPLHWAAVEEATPSVLRSLLLAGTKMNVGGVHGGGGVLVENSKGKTPLMMACDVLQGEIEESDDEDHDEDYDNLLWEKVYILVRATYAALAMQSNNVTLDGDAQLLHAVIETKCPQCVVVRTLSDNPQLMTARDYQGRTPLAIAASQHDVSPEVIKLLLGTDHFDSRIAGMATKEKRLLLHLAAESGWDFEHLEVIRQAAPAALETRDIPTRMYPFMLAAEGPHSNLNAVYQLLRASPRMARGMAEGIHWETSKLRLECENRDQRDQIAELEGENSELKKSNVKHLRKISEQAEENATQAEAIANQAEAIAKLEEEIRKLREGNQVVMDDSGNKRKKIGD